MFCCKDKSRKKAEKNFDVEDSSRKKYLRYEWRLAASSILPGKKFVKRDTHIEDGKERFEKHSFIVIYLIVFSLFSKNFFFFLLPPSIKIKLFFFCSPNINFIVFVLLLIVLQIADENSGNKSFSFE